MSSHIVPTRTYIKVYVSLIALLVATTLFDLLNLGFFNTVISLTIAVIKMVLVMLIFMHVKYMNRNNWLSVGAGLLWLFLLLGGTLGDYLSRVSPSGPFR